MGRAPRLIINGMLAFALALLMWRLTHNIYGWLAFFLPGSALVIYGIYRTFD